MAGAPENHETKNAFPDWRIGIPRSSSRLRDRNLDSLGSVLIWIIVKVAPRKESRVAKIIQDMGFEAWAPCQLVPVRPHASRKITAKAHLIKIREISLLPRRVFVEAPHNSRPGALYGDIAGVRHIGGLELGPASTPLLIDSEQLTRFRAAIDAENAAALALAAKPNRKQKARWKSLKDGLQDAILDARKEIDMAA